MTEAPGRKNDAHLSSVPGGEGGAAKIGEVFSIILTSSLAHHPCLIPNNIMPAGSEAHAQAQALAERFFQGSKQEKAANQ